MRCTRRPRVRRRAATGERRRWADVGIARVFLLPRTECDPSSFPSEQGYSLSHGRTAEADEEDRVWQYLGRE